jgi:hypothetical protein
MPGGNGVLLDLCHPRYVDEVAMRYPELTIIAGRAAWPWQKDMIAVLLHKPSVTKRLISQPTANATKALRILDVVRTSNVGRARAADRMRLTYSTVSSGTLPQAADRRDTYSFASDVIAQPQLSRDKPSSAPRFW